MTTSDAVMTLLLVILAITSSVTCTKHHLQSDDSSSSSHVTSQDGGERDEVRVRRTPGWGKRAADLLVPALSVSKRRGWGKRKRDRDNDNNCYYWQSLLQFIQVRRYWVRQK